MALSLGGGGTLRADVYSRADDTRATPPEYRQRDRPLAVRISAGGTYLAGNVDHVAVSATLAFMVRPGRRHELFVDGAATHAIFAGDPVIDKDVGSLMYVFALAEHWNLYAVSTHSRNRFLQLDYRTTNAAGVCLHGFGPRWLDPVLVSLDLMPENEWWKATGDNEASDPTAFALRASARASGRIALNDHAAVGVDVIYTPVLRSPADFRVYAEGYLDVKITPDVLSLRVTACDEYDSRPRPGVRHNDVSVVPALAVAYGTAAAH